MRRPRRHADFADPFAIQHDVIAVSAPALARERNWPYLEP